MSWSVRSVCQWCLCSFSIVPVLNTNVFEHPVCFALVFVSNFRLDSLMCWSSLVPREGCGCAFGFKGGVSEETCWMCTANFSDVLRTDTWRRASRYRATEVLARQTEQGLPINPLLVHAKHLGKTQNAMGSTWFLVVAGSCGSQVVLPSRSK